MDDDVLERRSSRRRRRSIPSRSLRAPAISSAARFKRIKISALRWSRSETSMLTCSHSSFTLLLPVAAIRPLAFGGETHKSFGDCIPLSGRWALQMHVMPAGQSAADSLRRILTAPRCRATSFTHQSAIILDAAAARCTVRTWVIGGRFPFPERRGILEADLQAGGRPLASPWRLVSIATPTLLDPTKTIRPPSRPGGRSRNSTPAQASGSPYRARPSCRSSGLR
jgi:hypothetical protein